MNIYKMSSSIIPLFSVPIFYQADSGRRLSETELKIVSSLDLEDVPNKFSKNRNILNLPGLEGLKEFCQSAIDTYAKEVCKVTDEFYITNSWTTKNLTSVEHHKHTHPNSIFSGIFYFHAEENAAPMTVHYKSPLFKNFALEYHYSGYSIFNSNDWSFPVRTGTLIIFPSWLEHGSLKNESSRPRELIGFNSFVRGKFGDFNYCSDLDLA
jgi:uncharacterized protein (TIGR02466 family)